MYTEVISVIYHVAQFLGGCMGVAVGVLTLRSVGFNTTKTIGSTREVGVGFGFILAILLALLSVGPLYVVEANEEWSLTLPNDVFLSAYGYVYVASSVAPLVMLAKGKRLSARSAWVPILGMISASWVTKTIAIMVAIPQAGCVHVVLKVVYEMLGVVYISLYLIAPYILLRLIPARRSPSAVPNISR